MIDYSKMDLKTFKSSEPFPNVTIDNLFCKNLMNSIVDNYPLDVELNWWKYDNIFEKKLAFNNIEKLHSSFRTYFNLINSLDFVRKLEKLTGISNLIADPSLYGGGLHRIKNGGKLDIHADFNYHKITGWKRRLNIITFLNRNWKEEYGGHTELWNKEMTHCVKRILPIFNRTIIFEVNPDSYHGHPHPLTCPEHVERWSLASYYFTVHDNDLRGNDYTSTDYQRLPSEHTDNEKEELRNLRRLGRLEDLEEKTENK